MAMTETGWSGGSELETLHRFSCLAARAKAQALHLTCSRAEFILREYVTMQLHASAPTLDAVEAIIVKREADMDPMVVRLRELANGHGMDGRYVEPPRVYRVREKPSPG